MKRTALTSALALAAVLATAGCSPNLPAPPAAPQSQPARQVSDDLTFAAGSKLSESDLPQMVESLAADDDWTLTSPDDGNGNWSYTAADGQCTVHFTQQLLREGVTVVPGDDRTTTDNYLDYVFAYEGKSVAENAADAKLLSGFEDQAEAQVRVLTGIGDDGTEWATYVRAFAEPRVGLVVDIACKPGADSAATIQGVIADVTISAS